MTACPASPPGRLRHLVYLAALATTAACLGWLVWMFAAAALSGEAEPLRVLQSGLMLLLVPFAPALFLLIAACWLAISGRPAPATFQFLALANAAWSVLLTSALVSQ